MDKVSENIIENPEKKDERKPYEPPMMTKHNPLDSVSQVVYYYYFH